MALRWSREILPGLPAWDIANTIISIGDVITSANNTVLRSLTHDQAVLSIKAETKQAREVTFTFRKACREMRAQLGFRKILSEHSNRNRGSRSSITALKSSMAPCPTSPTRKLSLRQRSRQLRDDV